MNVEGQGASQGEQDGTAVGAWQGELGQSGKRAGTLDPGDLGGFRILAEAAELGQKQRGESQKLRGKREMMLGSQSPFDKDLTTMFPMPLALAEHPQVLPLDTWPSAQPGHGIVPEAGVC